ncbi:hypothetical protein DFQ27_006894 [Actinomortierella ambigua]|uniref:Uncharacterized protein n=1 Tax=Actinomortierella ambigua TaxID=1343610 RepID=A0A9P6PV67_9FUNG|nr:hypothetical protein DFQ27_006894 [Actinomortierella ambigua]
MTSTFGGGAYDPDGRYRHRPSDLTCPATGFYCLETFFTATTPAPRPRSIPASGDGSDAVHDIHAFGGGEGGGGGGGGHDDPRLFYCQYKGRTPRVAATCPQGRCVRDYCVGSTGPIRVPEGLEGGDGVYCGRTLNRAVSKKMGFTTARMTNGGGHPEGGDKSNPREYGGYLDGDEFGYRREHLYYIRGNQGVDLGPCKGRCIRQEPGIPDYCEA